MGPHFFKCGKFCIRRLDIPIDHPASMGPHFFKCGKEIHLDRPDALEYSFNGAALFQVRKDGTRRRNFQPVLSFNGAALFQVRKANHSDRERDARS